MANDADKEVRLDKWLVAVRIFKTRGLAAKAISGGKIKLDGKTPKSSRPVQLGDKITYKREGITYQYTVTGIIANRVGAPEAVKNYTMEEEPDATPEMRDMLRMFRDQDRQMRRGGGGGKPSKKDRRELTRLKRGDF